MRITISARHCEITDTLKERATAVVERLAVIRPHALEATVVFDVDAGAQVPQVEIRLHARGRKVHVGLGEGPDHRTALDRAEEKLRHQLGKADRSKPWPRRAPAKDS